MYYAYAIKGESDLYFVFLRSIKSQVTNESTL